MGFRRFTQCDRNHVHSCCSHRLVQLLSFKVVSLTIRVAVRKQVYRSQQHFLFYSQANNEDLSLLSPSLLMKITKKVENSSSKMSALFGNFFLLTVESNLYTGRFASITTLV